MSIADDFNDGTVDLPTAAKLLVQQSTFETVPKGYVSVDGYYIDCVLQEQIVLDSDITDHPVETGGDVTENIRARPNVVTISGVVSDTPIGVLADIRASEGGNPSDAALAKLIQIRDSRDVVTIITSKKTFDDMAMQHLDVPADAKTGKALRFTATFKQVTFVTNDRQLVRVAVPQDANAKQQLGNVPSQTAKEPYYTDILGRVLQSTGTGAGTNKITEDNLAGRGSVASGVASGLSGLTGGN